MANYSYNDLKIEFEDMRENWMPAVLPPFQAPPSDNTSDADSKIYPGTKYGQAVRFFSDEIAFNPFCKRVNCYNVNLQHAHAHPETKQEYAKKVVRFLKKWQNKARGENSLDQTELSQLSKVIKFWEKKNPFKDQEEALLEHYNQTVFSNPVNSKICLEIVDKLKKEIKNSKITDDAGPDDPDYEMCTACLIQFNLVNQWEEKYRKKIDSNCRQGQHSQSPPAPSELELKIHSKCWMKVNKNNYNDIQPCGCSNVKVSDLLKASSSNLIKSFFILDKVKKIKKETPFSFHIEYLNGRSQVVSSNQQNDAYDDLVAYFQPLPIGIETTRKALSINDEPRDDTDLEEVRKNILDYFREHGIESIRLRNNKLVIKYNFKAEEEEEEEANSSELQEIQAYCQAKGINLLTLKDLKKGNDKQESGYGKLLFYGGITVAVVLVVGLIAYFAYRSEKNGPRRY